MDLKARVDELAARREALEEQMAAHSQRLEAAGVGLHSSLVDAQGYPRADVDVAAARADRHALYTLSNDHRAVTEELHTALGQLHAQRRAQGGSGAQGSAEAGAAAPSAPGPSPAAAAPAPTRRGAPLANGRPASAPFAVVDSVAAGSPAGTAGVRAGDQVLGFGAVAGGGGNALRQVAQLVQASEGRAVPLEVRREGRLEHLSVTPRRWAGAGLLGMHLRPL